MKLNKALAQAVPRGLAMSGEKIRLLLDALAESLDRAKLSIDAIKTEAQPATAVDTIDRWCELLGISPVGLTLSQKQALAGAQFSAKGGSNINYLNAKLQEAYPDLVITETGLLDYTVSGTVGYAQELTRAYALLMRIAPLHLEMIKTGRNIIDSDVARCGIGAVGRARCGRQNHV